MLLALKGFALHAAAPLCARYLAGTAASSLHEARLGAEEFGGELHVYAPAYSDAEFPAILEIADHVSFNSFAQWRRFRGAVEATDGRVSPGLRVNPEHSEVEVALYDPCAPQSRLGIPRREFDFSADALGPIRGLHFHALCGQGADVLERALVAVEEGFGPALERVEWVNFGGGHHITRAGYDVERLCALISRFRERYGVDVYLEPGEAIGWETGVLVASVLDVVRNVIDIAILDTSATAHMPDVLEMPYRPEVRGAGRPGEKPYSYRLGGLTCLAGDVIGDYSFDEPLGVGDRVVFEDMIHYTMVKTTTFNGVRLPSIALFDPETDRLRVVREFDYDDYRRRLS